MSSKKIILFIVEGQSEEEALEGILAKIIDSHSTKFRVVRYDITADNKSTIVNVKGKVKEQIDIFLKESRLKKADIDKVVHLIDTDGLYIDERYMKEADVSGFVYSNSDISCRDIGLIKERNARKSAIVNKLCELPKVYQNIDYEMYYFSMNLDHVLYNKINATDTEKRELSEDFSDKYEGREIDFISFISDHNIAVDGTIKETWGYLKIENNSLKRKTNFHLFFDKLDINNK